jgi:hypothetical protein
MWLAYCAHAFSHVHVDSPCGLLKASVLSNSPCGLRNAPMHLPSGLRNALVLSNSSCGLRNAPMLTSHIMVASKGVIFHPNCKQGVHVDTPCGLLKAPVLSISPCGLRNAPMHVPSGLRNALVLSISPCGLRNAPMHFPMWLAYCAHARSHDPRPSDQIAALESILAASCRPALWLFRHGHSQACNPLKELMRSSATLSILLPLNPVTGYRHRRSSGGVQ